MRLSIVGGASAYVPGLIRGILHRIDRLDGSEVVLYDIDRERLDIVARLAVRMVEAAGTTISVTASTDIDEATSDVDHLLTTFRPGGLAGRAIDERIPLDEGVVGQETAGPGGFLLACRAVPVVLDLAARLERRSPGAWIANYTNPTSVVTDAVRRHSPVPIIGLCDQHAADTAWWADRLGYPPASFEPRWFGLNHATWATEIIVDGRDATAEVWAKVDDLEIPADPTAARLVRMAQTLRALPNDYARYYVFHDETVAELRAAGPTRGERLLARSPAWYEDYRRAADAPIPDPSTERGGVAHGEFAIDVICALSADERRRLLVNVRNDGAIHDLDADATVEVPALIGRTGPERLVCGRLPPQVRGLTAAIAGYERLAADAAVSGNRAQAVAALASHPFVRSLDVAVRILDRGLAQHAADLPQFGAGA